MHGGAASLAKCDCVTQLAQKRPDLSITVALSSNQPAEGSRRSGFFETWLRVPERSTRGACQNKSLAPKKEVSSRARYGRLCRTGATRVRMDAPRWESACSQRIGDLRGQQARCRQHIRCLGTHCHRRSMHPRLDVQRPRRSANVFLQSMMTLVASVSARQNPSCTSPCRGACRRSSRHPRRRSR